MMKNEISDICVQNVAFTRRAFNEKIKKGEKCKIYVPLQSNDFIISLPADGVCGQRNSPKRNIGRSGVVTYLRPSLYRRKNSWQSTNKTFPETVVKIVVQSTAEEDDSRNLTAIDHPLYPVLIVFLMSLYIRDYRSVPYV